MLEGKSLCVVCAWRMTCNKKFSMDGSTTTKCVEFTRDVMLDEPKSKTNTESEDSQGDEHTENT